MWNLLCDTSESPLFTIVIIVIAVLVVVKFILPKLKGGKKGKKGGKKSSSNSSDDPNTGYIDSSTSEDAYKYNLPGGPLTKFEEEYFMACYLNDVKAEVGPTGDDYGSMSDFLDSKQYKSMSDGAKELAMQCMTFLLRDRDIDKYIKMTGSSNVKRRFAEYCRVEEQD